MTKHWSAEFVGLPWLDKGRAKDGVDCWGIPFLVFAAVGIELPSYAADYTSVAERRETAALFDRGAKADPWVPVACGAEDDRDLVLFRSGLYRRHVGVICGRGLMLHIPEGGISGVTSFRTGYWQPKLVGQYRHQALRGEAGV